MQDFSQKVLYIRLKYDITDAFVLDQINSDTINVHFNNLANFLKLYKLNALMNKSTIINLIINVHLIFESTPQD